MTLVNGSTNSGGKRIIVVDSQKLNMIQMCALKYKYTFGESIEPVLKPDYFERGELLHYMLAMYYNSRRYRARWIQNNKTHADVVSACVKAGRVRAVQMQLQLEDVEDVMTEFVGYTTHTANDGWDNIITVEQVGSKILHESKNYIILYEVKIDLIISLSNCPILPVDHKSVKKNQYPEPLSNQFMGYCWFLDVHNIVVNKIGFQRTLKPAEKYQRHTMSYSSDRLGEWKEDSIFWIEQLMRYIDSGYYPPNLTSCDKYSGCIFRECCRADKETRLYKLQTLFEAKPQWDVGQDL